MRSFIAIILSALTLTISADPTEKHKTFIILDREGIPTYEGHCRLGFWKGKTAYPLV